MNAPLLTSTSLPTVDGRAPRVAVLVFNDFTVDTRVLKTAQTFAAAGAQVRVFAFSSYLGMAPGLTVLDDGVELERLPLVEIDHVPARVGARARRAVARLRGGRAEGSRITEPATSYVTDVPSGPAPVSAPGPAGPAASLVDLWMRAHYTLRLASFQHRVRRAVAAWAPDVVHANDADTLLPAWQIHRTAGVPYVYDAHEIWTHRVKAGKRPVARRWEAWVEKRLAPRAAGTITVSPSIVDWMRTNLRLTQDPTLIRNIPPLQDRDLTRADGRLHELAGLDLSARVIAYCGAITANRGIEETVAALPYLDDSTHLVLLGRGSEVYLDTLRASIEAQSLSDRVHFAGIVPSAQVPAALMDADASVVFVRPVTLNQRYCLPNKLFESIHAGLPIAATNVPDMAEIVTSHGVGEVFDLTGPRETAEAITKVIAQSAQFREAAVRAARALNWQQEAERLVGLYSTVIGQDGGGARTGSARRGTGRVARAAQGVAAFYVKHQRRLPRRVTTAVEARARLLPPRLGDAYDQAMYRFTSHDRVPPPALPLASNRLYVAPTNYAGQGSALARTAERHRGTGAVSMKAVAGAGRRPAFSYPVDYAVPKNVYLGSRIWQRDQRAYVGSFTHVIAESGQPLFSPDGPGASRTELLRLLDDGMQVALLFHGTDIRLPSRHVTLTPWSPFADGALGDTAVFEAQSQAHRNDADVLHARGVSVFVTTPDLLADVPYATWWPVVVEPARWRTDTLPLQRAVPVVVHAPSSAAVKGSDLIEPALEALAAEGIIEYQRVQGVPWEEMPALYARADIVLDQFRIGNYGVAACEAMAAGRLVLSHVTDAVREAAAGTYGLDLPVLETTATSVADRIHEILADRPRFQELAAAGPAYVDRVHDGRASAEVLAPFLAGTGMPASRDAAR
ncbi:glycosyltransferase [Sanguibacter suarezii]|uniref:glycosyltransferase n=1 Tax=Sanguibacter suarezii TaxID=60921 RepID=UPI000835D561|nr:glycosyltransferase [Sanguibacter suarezii]